MTESPIYLDNAATSWPKPEAVAEAMASFLRDSAGNPGRGGHLLARRGAVPLEAARERIGRMIGAPCVNRVVLCGGCTDAVNLAIHGVLRHVLKDCPEGHTPTVVTTVAEHNAVSRTLHCYELSGEVRIAWVGVDEAGRVDPEEYLAACRECTVLACLTAASNAVGTVQPVGEIGRRLRERSPEALFLVDAAQTVGHFDTDVVSDEIDLLAMAGHKGMLGPTGTGALYVGPRAFSGPDTDDDAGGDRKARRLFCQRRGGTGAKAEGLEMPNVLPDALEAGTENAVGFAGLVAGIDAREAAWHAHEMAMTARLLDGLRAIDEVRVQGVDGLEGRTPVVLFSVPGRCPREVAEELDGRFGVCARGGTHCAPLLHRAIGNGEAGAVRLSPGWATTEEEVEAAVRAVEQVVVQARPRWDTASGARSAGVR